ncbi:MAG TPA: fused MFS/spermidine synthase [Bryobacteraceae bacterium]|nr:fused MFS/spermidine synthase [Bryobacteraceae bacterium]
MLLYALTISLSAFLLFEVQPVIAKMILPWFGGTSAVWTTCLLFFQAVLLGGYLYAHWLHEKLPSRRQAWVHIAVLAVSIAALPIIPGAAWKTATAGNPSLRILLLLAATVGAPYFVLSSTSPLLQAWYARRHRGGMPYRLFALSNGASMLALLSYPLMVEPTLPTRMQGMVWSAAYVLFAALCGLTAWRSSHETVAPTETAADAPGDPPPSTDRFLWLMLSACASVLLLAVTTHLTQDIAAIPFLWILPLSVYLLSFMVCFEAPRLYHRGVFLPLVALSLAYMAYELWPYRQSLTPPDFLLPALLYFQNIPMRASIVLFALALFVCCMVCHGELVRTRPHPRYLTGFYVAVSLGGVCGGLFVGLLAPAIFHSYDEFPIGLALCALLVFRVLYPDTSHYRGVWKWIATGALAAAACSYVACLLAVMQETTAGYRLAERNFYGQLKVREDGDQQLDEFASLQLIHGTINHGEQFVREPYRHQPVTYFCPDSGVGRAMHAQEGHPRRIGMLGLGCGTLAAYGLPGDTLHVYEINPLVVDIANRQFTYLRDTPAKVEITMGDGRLSLESEPSQQFDVLVMDAFSGDSVPVHLITREAFQTYFRHLKRDGILAVNITNNYLDLEPVMESAAASVNKVAYSYSFQADPDDEVCFTSSWALIMDRSTWDARPGLHEGAKLLRPSRRFRTWTDDFSNLLGILR